MFNTSKTGAGIIAVEEDSDGKGPSESYEDLEEQEEESEEHDSDEDDEPSDNNSDPESMEDFNRTCLGGLAEIRNIIR
jgi:hypothetical protein